MKRLFLLSATALMATMMSAQTAARMDSLKPEQKAMAVSLKLTGELSTDVNGDYRQMRDLLFSAMGCPKSLVRVSGRWHPIAS